MAESTRNENSARNVFYSILKQVFLLFLNFFVKTIFIKILGENYLGINGLFNQIFFLFSFAEFGIGTAMVYSFYEPFARRDRKKCAALYHYFRKLYLGMSLFILTLGIALIPFLGYMVDLDMPIAKIRYYYVLYLTGTLISNLFLYKSNVLVSDQNQYLVSKIQLLLESLCFFAQIVVLEVFRSFEWYLACMVFKYIMIGWLTNRSLNQQYPYLINHENLEEREKNRIKQNMKTLFIYKFSKVLINSTDNIIISLLVGTVWIGYYSNYDFVIVGVFGLVSAFFSALSASVGNLIVEKEREDQYRIYRVIEMLNFWISGFTSTCLLILFQDFIYLWIGAKYQLEIPVMIVIVLNYFLKSMRESISMFRESAGLFQEFKNVTVITALLNILLSFLLGHFWGMIGILGATAIAVLVTYFWYEPYLIFSHLFHRPLNTYFLRQAKNFIVFLAGAGVTFLLGNLLSGTNLLSFCYKIIICIIVPNVLYFLVLKNTREMQIIFEMVKDIMRKFKARRN